MRRDKSKVSQPDSDPTTSSATSKAHDAADARVRLGPIGKELRRIYDAIAAEPVPDEMLELLKKLDKQAEN